MNRLICLICVGGALLIAAMSGSAHTTAAQEVRGPVYVVDVQGPITSVTTGYLRRAVRQAESAEATALIIRLSSTGGVLNVMRPFAAELAAANVPVVVYVPAGTDAGTAGALLLSAAHINAMAPGTSFGSPYPLTQVDATLSQQTQDLVLDSVADQLREWNAAQGRNTDWIDQAVRDGAILSNERAIGLEPPAVDLIAADSEQLLTLLEGRTVTLGDGSSVSISTLGRSTTPIQPTLWEGLRLALANPTVAFVLLILGTIAIYMEFAAPGTAIFAGVGVVFLIGALAGLLVLPIQWWALILLITALLLVGAEFFVTSHGILTAAGLVMIVISALNMIDPMQAPGTFVALWVVLLIVLALGSFVALGVLLAVRGRSRPVTTGQEGLVGKMAEVRKRLDPEGMVFVEGALWRAVSEHGDIEVGDYVQVSAMHNLRLVVRRIDMEQDA